MKFLVGALASACMFTIVSAASADVVLPDQTKVVSYHGTSPTNYFGVSSIGDVVGPGFDTTGYSVSESGNSITIKYYTQFNGDDLTAHYADLFITPNNANGSPAAWGFGVALGYQQAFGGEAAGLYALSGASDYKTSQDIWASKTNYVYGGRYIAPGEVTPNLVPTQVTGGFLETGWTVDADAQQVGSHYELTITLTAADATTFSLLDGTNLDLLWGTGDCSNDAVFAEYTRPVKTPEPASIALFAGGLLALRRRRK
jgi:hypothetical protein